MNNWSILALFFIISISLPAVGQAQNFYAPGVMDVIRTPSATTTNVIPATVDVLVEADTYVPFFYQGRREPSPGNPIKLVAMVNGYTGTDNLRYQWQINGTGLAGTDRTVFVTAPNTDQMNVALTVTNSTGQKVAGKSENIPLSRPVILLYEDNLLRGRSQVAIGEDFLLVGDEASLIAEPYFVPGNAKSGEFLTRWSVNGQNVDGSDWHTIALERPESAVTSYNISYSLQHRTKVLNYSSQSFTLNFGL